MKSRWTAALLLPLAASSLQAQAQVQVQGQDALYTRSLAATCAACHGTDGRVVGDAGVAALAGQPRDRLAARLREFRDGSRPSTVMGQLSRGFSEAQIERLAAYFSALQP